MKTDISVLKNKLFYVASIVALLGQGANLIMGTGGGTLIVDAVSIVFLVVTLVLYKSKIIKTNWANGILAYTIFFNLLISVIINSNEDNFEGLLFLSAMTSLAMILYVGFTLNKIHLFVIGVIYIVFYSLSTHYSDSYFTRSNNVLVLVILIGFLFAVHFIVKLLNRYHNYQKELIEDLKKRNALLKKQGVELGNLNNTKDKLFSIIGHDLKSPASSIMGFADLISMKSDECESRSIKEFSKHIYSSANMLNLLLEQLLNWARIQTGKMKINIVPVKINDEINEIIDLMKGITYLKSISIEKPKVNDITVECDKQMILTVIRNLLSNALKYTPKGGVIKVHSEVLDGKYQFLIKDCGLGMDTATLNSLFKNEPIESQRGTEYEKGTGLGLVICNEYVNIHKGNIWAESELGKGSSFYFSIPMK